MTPEVRALLVAICDALDQDPDTYPTRRAYLEDMRDRGAEILAVVATVIERADEGHDWLAGGARHLAIGAPRNKHNRPRQAGEPIPTSGPAKVES
jgi:hypothetical protein